MSPRKALTKKMIVLGVDGMDPKLTKKYVEEGYMPHTKHLIAQGAAREDLVLLGAQPTVTPPMWTTLATGAYPITHGITCFSGKGQNLDETTYNLDSRRCQAEQLWNVFAEAGKKTLVWHWPGSSWPPTSDSPLLHVVDGLCPSTINAFFSTGGEGLLIAHADTPNLGYKARAASDSHIPCVINEEELQSAAELDYGAAGGAGTAKKLTLYPEDGEATISAQPFDVQFSPIKPADSQWAAAPVGAKEFTLQYSGGLIRRPGLILCNEQGVYDQVALYKNKEALEPMVILSKDVFVGDVLDEGFYHDERIMANRNMRVLELAEDGSLLRMWISSGGILGRDNNFSPNYLYEEVTSNVGPIPQMSCMGGSDKELISKCMLANWAYYCDWQARALNHLIKALDYEMIFSQLHNIDLIGHMIVKFLKDKGQGKLTEAEYAELLRDAYVMTDKYIGEFMHLLEKDWTVILVSDHAQICPEYEPLMIGDAFGVNVRFLEELGLTALKKDEAGQDLYEIDWAHTYAIQQRANHIYLNIKGRDPYGIIAPEDQYEWEEEIMTRLYGYKHPVSGKRVIALALRNKDAILLGQGGPEAGDILFWNAEGYNYDHADCLSTTLGYADTSVSPIFIAAGPGIKAGFTTKRIIRQVDVAPTMAVLAGVRMPRECEGAPVYQILAEEF